MNPTIVDNIKKNLHISEAQSLRFENMYEVKTTVPVMSDSYNVYRSH